MQDIKLIALDLDGTLFNDNGIISDKNIEYINKAILNGVEVVISTGRPFSGLPFKQLSSTKIKYAITTNGAGVYEIPNQKCIFGAPMDNSVSFPVIDFLLSKDIHFDIFIDGKSYSPTKCLPVAKQLPVPQSLKEYILTTRTRIDDIKGFITENNLKIQKITVNFKKDENGILTDRNEVKDFLTKNPDITVVSGGYNNLEFTLKGIDKGVGLNKLAAFLNIPMESTMAIGDTENDLAIINAAAIGIAMGNATDIVKEKADYTTLSNNDSGVAEAIKHFTCF